MNMILCFECFLKIRPVIIFHNLNNVMLHCQLDYKVNGSGMMADGDIVIKTK